MKDVNRYAERPGGAGGAIHQGDTQLGRRPSAHANAEQEGRSGLVIRGIA